MSQPRNSRPAAPRKSTRSASPSPERSAQTSPYSKRPAAPVDAEQESGRNYGSKSTPKAAPRSGARSSAPRPTASRATSTRNATPRTAAPRSTAPRSAASGYDERDYSVQRSGASSSRSERPRSASAPARERRPQPTANSLNRPGALITRRASDRLRAGHLWVYASDIEAIELPEGDAPALLPVADNRGLLLGTALYSPSSQIALRMISREEINEAEWLELLAKRLRTAIQRRRALLESKAAPTDSLRLCFSEADEIPGLVIDQYAELVILQILTRGLDTPGVRSTVVEVLKDELNPTTILERPDSRIREIEGLSAPDLSPLWVAKSGKAETSASFHINGLTLSYDANTGQKTGAFLDQRCNYAAARDWAKQLGATGRALDVCTYQGGFALHLAKVAKEVTGVDQSRASLEVAEENLAANKKQLSAEVDWVHGDAFELMRNWSDTGEKFDIIVLDPPAFAKSKRAVEGALRGYKELNLRALKMLKPGGLLVSCSCSHHVSGTDLESMVSAAAADAHRRVRLLERRGAAPDHPVVLNMPETEYLKCLLMEVE